MQTRRLCAGIILLTVSVLGAQAQGAPGLPGPAPAAPAVPLPLVTVQMGYDLGYNVGASNVGNAFDMSLILALADNLQVGVTFLTGDLVQFQSYRLIELYYTVMPRLGAIVSIGSQITPTTVPVVGLGVYSNLLGKDVQGSLQTGLRLIVGYLAPVGASFNTGTIRLGIVAWVGM